MIIFISVGVFSFLFLSLVTIKMWYHYITMSSCLWFHQFDLLHYFYCVRGTRTQPLICVGCSVHYWVSSAINKGDFFEIAFVSTHICLTLKRLLPFCLTLTRSVFVESSKGFIPWVPEVLLACCGNFRAGQRVSDMKITQGLQLV